MRKIIDGKRYDTDQAEMVLEWHNGRYTSDFRHRSKTLYRTKNGAWFIHHEGGPLTDMAVPVGDNASGGSETIEPVSEEHAFRFLCSHDGEKQAEELFPDRITDA